MKDMDNKKVSKHPNYVPEKALYFVFITTVTGKRQAKSGKTDINKAGNKFHGIYHLCTHHTY